MNILYILRFIWTAGFTSVYRVLPSYLSNAFSALQISTIHSAYALPKLVNIPSGWLADRFGKQKTIFMTFILLSIVTLLFTVSEGILHYALMFFLVGLIGNFFNPTISALATMFSERNTETLFRLESMYQLGVVVGPIIGGFLMFSYGINAAFYAWFFLSLVGLGISSVLLRRERPSRAKEKKVKVKRPSLWKQLGDRKSGFLVFLVTGTFLTGFFESVMAITVPLYASGLGFSLVDVGIIIGVGAAISTAALFFLGKRMESLKREHSLILTTLLAGSSFLIMMFVSSLIGIAIITGLFITGRAGGLNVGRSFIADNLHADIRTTGMSLSDMLQYGARIIGPLFAGFAIDFIGIGFVFTSVFVFSLLGAGLVLVYSIMT